MAWSESEVEQVKAAVLALATGTRVVTVQYAGPPARSVSYGLVDLPQLRSLLSDMESSIATPAPRFRRAAFSKGFGPLPGDE